jgi:transcriptional regulator with XRE-family HTH domain
VGARELPAERGKRIGRAVVADLVKELRAARLTANLSQSEVARASGMSKSALSRIERGKRSTLGVVQLATALAVVGRDLSARCYPSGASHLDVAHARLLARLRKRLPDHLDWRSEVPLPGFDELRSWDAMIFPAARRVAIDAETRVRDGQELQRRLNVKRRDDQLDRLVLLLADTRANRLFVRDYAESLRDSFPVPGAVALRALEAGKDPGGDAIILL